MQIKAEASQWTNSTTLASAAGVPIGSAAVYVRMRVAIAMLPSPVTTVIVDVSDDGEGWIPVKTFTQAGVPKFIGYGGSARAVDGSAPQGGVYAMDYIRVYENRVGPFPELTTSGGAQQLG